MNAFNSSLNPSCEMTTLLPDSRARRDAERSAIRTLLNCYLREVAIPGGSLMTSPGAQILQTLPLGWRQKQRSQRWLLIDLQHSCQQLMVAVSRHTLLGNYRYAYPVLGRSTTGDGAAWTELDAMQMTTWLVADLCDAEGMPFNLEFTQQIKLSLENTANILAHRLQHSPGPDAPEDLYLFSEQSLAFGHAFHPTPKSRQWHADGAEAGYAPEYRSTFRLHWFRVPQSLLRCETVEPLSPAQLLADIAPADISKADGECLIPVHPAQAQYVLSLPVTQRAIESGALEYLGPAGDEYAATASVRTLYNRDTPWFIKGSLNVRITNCVRKNAIYELETALALHRRLTEIKADLQSQHHGFRLLGEPGFMTLQLPGLDSADNTLIQEGFGVVFRENINRVLSDGEQAVMAGALFQEGNPLRDAIHITDKALWLHHYAEALVLPMLHAFFAHGVIFEPHLQNTVICLKDGLPSGVIVRDFEGVKLVDSRWSAADLEDLNDRARQSVRYSFEQGWNRVRYCLLINNLSEAVSFLADDNPETEQQLWLIIHDVISGYLNSTDNALAQKHLTALLNGEAIPSKTNLLVRIKKHPDRQAGYVYLNSPFATAKH